MSAEEALEADEEYDGLLLSKVAERMSQVASVLKENNMVLPTNRPRGRAAYDKGSDDGSCTDDDEEGDSDIDGDDCHSNSSKSQPSIEPSSSRTSAEEAPDRIAQPAAVPSPAVKAMRAILQNTDTWMRRQIEIYKGRDKTQVKTRNFLIHLTLTLILTLTLTRTRYPLPLPHNELIRANIKLSYGASQIKFHT
jgi:hypothetical protein